MPQRLTLQSLMIMNKQTNFFLFILFMMSSITYAQIENDSLGTQTVNIEKTFIPSVTEAKKIKSVPEADNSSAVEKLKTTFQIQSIPVASVFNPAKPNARKLVLTDVNKFFANRLMMMAGNYGTLIADFSGAFKLSINKKVSVLFDHYGSQGGVAETKLEDDFSATHLELDFSNITRSNEWSINGLVGFQKRQWYGVPKGLWHEEQLNDINNGHQWVTYSLGSVLKPDLDWLEKMEIQFDGIADNYDNAEIVVLAETLAQLPAFEDTFQSTFAVQYRKYQTPQEEDQTFDHALFTLSPTFKIQSGDLSLDLGASGYYQLTDDPDASEILIVPNIHLSYLVDALVLRFKATGKVDQHTYRNFLSRNNYFGPNNSISAEEIPLHLSAGVEMPLSSDWGWNASASYESAKRKSMFVLNAIDENIFQDYSFGNSFGLLIDDIKTSSFKTGLMYTGFDKATIHVSGTYNQFSTSEQTYFFNRPNLEAALIINATLSDNWSMSLIGIFFGDRKDVLAYTNEANGNLTETINISSFADINWSTVYKLSERWSAEARVNNIFDAKQARWGFYNVQGIQALVGLHYNFDW